MSGKPKTEMETLAATLIAKYPNGYLSEIEIGWPCGIAIRSPLHGMDSPRAIVQGSYKEVRNFEIAYSRAKGTA